MKNRLAMLFACFLLFVWMAPGYGLSPEERNAFECFFTRCRSRSDTTPLDDLRAYAKASGLSDAEMASRLLELAKEGWNVKTDSPERRLAGSALCYLGYFGGEAEGAFVLQVMREADDEILRRSAARTAIRLLPEETGELLREAVADKRFGELDRFQTYKAVFQLGRDGDGKTRQRVIEVLSEMREKDSYQANRDCLGRWIAELKGGDAWEAWLREVYAGEGFNDAARRDACELAMQAGRNGDARTRQRVIEVFGELCDDESLDVDRAALRRWIAELEKMP